MISGEFNVQQHLHVLSVLLGHIPNNPQHLQHVHNVLQELIVNKLPSHAAIAQLERTVMRTQPVVAPVVRMVHMHNHHGHLLV